MLKYPALGMIWLYQRTLSPDHGFLRHVFPYGYCKFHPTCSDYMKQAVLKYGFFRGLGKGMARILRCHPFSRGGFDPIK